MSKESLLPPTPSVYLDNKKDAFSAQLQDFCLQHPITVVRGIAGALKMDCGLFSTKALLECNPSQSIEIKSQLRPDAVDAKHQAWRCNSTSSVSTLGKFAKYQMSQFQENLREEQEKTTSSGAAAAAYRHEARKKAFPYLRFADNVDMSDQRRWRMQLSELTKLPAWAKVVSAGNMLSHIGHQLQGMNTVRLTMKVPGARAPAHQDSFCTININIGPGDCEWFGVPDEYWGALKSLCEKHGVNFLHSSWWPNMQDLNEDDIPVYRFLQRPGDLVWVNSGCVHWTQAAGWCNSITWKVAPFNEKQYKLALDRYEWNKQQNCRSVIGLIHLSWNMARNVRLTDSKLYEIIKKVLLQSFKQAILTQEFVQRQGIELRYHGHHRSDPANFCAHCDIEVFGVLFIRAEDTEHKVQCLNCARRSSPTLKGFICLEEYKIKELCDAYDAFKLQQPHNSPTLPSSASTAAQMAAAMAAQNAAAAAAAAAASNPSMQTADLIAAMTSYQRLHAAQAQQHN